GSIWSVSPKLRVWMPPLDEAQRAQYAIPESQGALLVKWINVGSDGGRAAKAAGLREGDIVIARDGQPVEAETNDFNVYLKLNYRVGDDLPLTVLREGERHQISIRLVE